jgi:hypothetical protein
MQIEAETQPAAEPEVTETPEATVVSESAPEPQPEVVADVAEPVTEEPATPVAIAAADSILAKYNAISAERDSLRAELVAAKGQLSREREALAPARVVPVIENASPEAADPVAEYIAAVESGDRKKAASLFEKHKAAIWSHRNKISKA